VFSHMHALSLRFHLERQTGGLTRDIERGTRALQSLVSFYAHIVRVGNTSITVHVDVYAERNPANLQVVKVTEASLTYVAIDGQGKPRPIPKD